MYQNPYFRKPAALFTCFCLPLSAWLFSSCHNQELDEDHTINFSFQFDPDQPRLDNFGNPATMPAGHTGQDPEMRGLSVHYLEITKDPYTLLGQGVVLYKAPETTAGGDNAIDFDSAIVAPAGATFLKLDIDDLPPGTYKYVRASVAYQNYTIKFNVLNIPLIGDLLYENGTVASFIGFNTYIRNLTVNHMTISVFANKLQGYWAFETSLSPPYDTYDAVYSGDAPAGATTVVNPLFATSPVPAGSCVITGEFDPPLEIDGDEKSDLYITLSFSINQSFEWIDTNGNGEFDIDASDSTQTEQIVDMGLRGLIPTWKWK